MKTQTLYSTIELPIDHDHLHASFTKTGALLIKGNYLDIHQFEIFSENICEEFHHVGARRVVAGVLGDGFTTNVPEKNMTLLAHSEGLFRPCITIPDTCIFYCVTPPDAQGGETTLIDGAEMLSLIPPYLRNRFEEQGVIYEVTWESARWTAEFNVNNESELKTFLARFPGVQYSLSDSILNLLYHSPAVTRASGLPSFANGILAHLPDLAHPRYANKNVHVRPTNKVYFGNGEPLGPQVINMLVDIQDEVIFKHRWNKGDMLIIDNLRFMHGREITSRDCERILYSRFGRLKRRIHSLHS